MAKGQESVTLSPYPVFVVQRLIGTFGTGKSSVIDFMIKDWITSNTGIIEQANATIGDFLRETENEGR